MNLFDTINSYKPTNPQEAADKELMLEFMTSNYDYLHRDNKLGHVTVSAWTVNKERTKVLMVHHNIYNSWSWVGGHADGMKNLAEVALKELREETGIKCAELVSEDIFSLEILAVQGHLKKGEWVPSHLHYNVTYLIEADENDLLQVQEEENSAVKWWAFEDIAEASTEPWMINNIYHKLVLKTQGEQEI